MKKYFYILAALSIVPNLSLAQAGNFDAEVDQELDQMYANKQAAVVANPAPTTAAVGGTAAQGSQPIYILNQATPTSTATAQSAQVQKQPVAVIESTPLVESKAEMMRKSRQDAEVQTEQKIVEKLEASRLEDERRRADVLFGNKFEQMQGASTQIKAENSNVTVSQGQAQAQTPVVVQAAPVVTPVEPKENIRDVVREELAASKNSLKLEEVAPAPTEVRYFSGIVGIGDYPDVKNVRGNYSFGAAFGTKYDSLIVEGSFLYSNYTVEKLDCNCVSYFPTLVDTNQYQAAVSAKYQMLDGMVRPVLGGLIAYSYRKYDWNSLPNYSPYNTYGTSSDSHAIDLGVTAGVDLELSKKFALGFEYRYMFNLSSRVDNQSIIAASQNQYGTPLEKLSYYTLALAAKVNF
ncbi:MAG: outer membrane beta-barrel protein [Bdellovibrionales bacterium]|nr:outer membrane beta-barrel protein [Bdellovibrionales bacterium]